MSYTPTYKRPYEQWKELPSKETLVTAEVLTQYDDTFENIEEYLESEGKKEYALVTEAGYSIVASIDEYYVLTVVLNNKAGDVLSTSEPIDLPIESMIINVDYDEESGILTFSLQNGQTLDVNISTLVRGLVPTSRKIAGVDLEDDITAEELKTALGVFDSTVTAGELKPWLYDTENEVEIGVYNGKPLYRKIIELAPSTSTGNVSYNHNIENIEHVHIDTANSFIQWNTGTNTPLPYFAHDEYAISLTHSVWLSAITESEVRIYQGTDRSSIGKYIVSILYTKTTDAEGSGNSLNPYGIYDAKLDDVKSTIASVSDEVDAVEEQLSDKVLPQYKHFNLSATGWYRFAVYNGLTSSDVRGGAVNGCDIILRRDYATRPSESHEIKIIPYYNSDISANTVFKEEISTSGSFIITKIRYCYNGTTNTAYIDLYYSSNTNNTAIAVINNHISVSKRLWNLVTPYLVDETIEGETIHGIHEFSANKSYESEIDAINSRLAYQDISSSIDVGETGCTALGYVENGQVCINIRVPQGSSSNILSQIHVATNYAPRNTTGGYLTIIGTGSDIGKLSGTIMADGAVSIFVTNALDASEIISFTYPLKSS